MNVVIANALGTGVLESAAWLGFLPGVAERLLGESLQLPAAATWWCGEKPALDYVLEKLDRLDESEAASRRAERFQAGAFTPGPMEAPPPDANPYFPLTLDLRRAGPA